MVLDVTFNFDIIAASHLAVRNRSEWSHELLTLSPVGTSGRAVGQSHHPGDDEAVMQNSRSAWLDFAQGGIVVRVQTQTTVSWRFDEWFFVPREKKNACTYMKKTNKSTLKHERWYKYPYIDRKRSNFFPAVSLSTMSRAWRRQVGLS